MPRLAALTSGITIIAFAARVVGIRFGLPHQFHPDENLLISTAARMAEGAD